MYIYMVLQIYALRSLRLLYVTCTVFYGKDPRRKTVLYDLGEDLLTTMLGNVRGCSLGCPNVIYVTFADRHI